MTMAKTIGKEMVTKPTMTKVGELIRTLGVVDPWAKRIWAAIIPRAAVLLWRARWQRIPTYDRLLW